MTSASMNPFPPGNTSQCDLERSVLEGLCVADDVQKSLPPRLFYDDEGSRLFTAITALPEYYLTRTERALLRTHADAIVAEARGDAPRLHIVELGAGIAEKTQILLEAAVRLQGSCLFLPIDVSSGALDEATRRLGQELPQVEFRPFVGRHDEAVSTVQALGPRRLVCFIGSSLGNFEDDENIALLQNVAKSLGAGGTLLLGADRKKAAEKLIPAYDDAAGVTARFNKNVLVRLNREIGADFDVDAFDHQARFNEALSRIEMHLVARGEQLVRFPSLHREVRFRDGESIHTESSIKYDDARIEAIVGAAGFDREHSFVDDDGLFGLHLCRRR